MEAAGYIASLVMGIVLGLMGGGGSILTVPILVYLFGIVPSLATGYSLFVVGVTAMIGSAMYVRKGDVDFKAGLVFALPSVAGVNLSRGLILPSIPQTPLKEILIMGLFAVLMIFASYSMIAKRKPKTPGQGGSGVRRMILIGAQGLVVGMLAGFVGAGGGFLIIPALVVLAGLSMRIAVGTSLMIIAIQSLTGFAGDLIRGTPVDWVLLGTVAGIAVTGIVAGSAIAHKIDERKLKTAFGWFVLVMGSAIFIEQVRHLQ